MYQVLARKYRPKNFHQLLGQDHVAKALVNAIHQQRLHHAYLFTGTRGVGKTTIARILAKCLNCETGITSEPCGVCSTCQAIDAGRFIDLIEIDAASRTKVEDTRELLDNVPYAPTQGRYKVYLIDEVHMLSTHSFNALLKTLEEPPEHVKFLLATTDPQKLPITIISRCLQFVLRPLPQPQLAEYLGKILTQEQITFTQDVLWQLASSAKGSVRDALSLTDQAIAFGNGQINDETLAQMLGLIDQADVIHLLTVIYQQDRPQFAQALHNLREQVVDAKAVFDRLAEVLHQVALLQLLPNFDLQMQRQQQQALQQLAQSLPAELVQLYYEIVVKSRENISLANTPTQALEMCLLRMLAFKPLTSLQVTPTPISQTPNVEQSTDSQTAEKLEPQTEPSEQTSSQQPIGEEKVIQLENNQDNILAQSEAQTDITENIDTKNPISDSELPQGFDKPREDNSDKILTQSPINQDIPNQPSVNHNQPQIQPIDENSLANLSVEVTPITDNSQNNAELVSEQNLINSDWTQHPASQAIKNPIESNQINSLVTQDQSPLDLLKPNPQPLEGAWTAEKWDYWVSQARDKDWLDEGELAMAKVGVVTGQIGSRSVFSIGNFSPELLPIFSMLQQKLKVHLNTQLELQQGFEGVHHNSPQMLQEMREAQVQQLVTEQIKQQPVVQALFEQNASISLVKFNKF